MTVVVSEACHCERSEANWREPIVDIGCFSRYFANMIKDAAFFDREKKAWLSAQHLSLEQKFEIQDALFEEARSFGHFGNHDILDGIDHVVHLAAMLNANVSRPSR